MLQILAQGEDWLALHKLSGDHVHPPENKRLKVPRERIILYRLRDQLGRHVYPVHRLDAATSGVLLMALTSQAASHLGRQFQERRTRKTYQAVVRGWPEAEGVIDRPLASDSTGELAEAVTEFRCLDRLELPLQTDETYPRRYAWLELRPRTGRFHQLRRHLNKLAHPIIGDGAHGDYRHNRFFRETLGIEGLCLNAITLGFHRPEDNGWTEVHAPETERWQKLSALFASYSVSSSSAEPEPFSSSPKSSKASSPSAPKSSSAADVVPEDSKPR